VDGYLLRAVVMAMGQLRGEDGIVCLYSLVPCVRAAYLCENVVTVYI
jgi:hypothetical protein